MNVWTEAARQELDHYLIAVRQQLAGGDADPQEVVENLERHILEEAEARFDGTLTRGDIRLILNELGPLNEEPARPLTAPGEQDAPTNGKGGPRIINPLRFKLVFTLFAVVLPLIAIGIEVTIHFCAQHLFDPLPTLVHAFLVAGSPICNVLVGFGRADHLARHRKKYLVLNGMALGVSFYYSLVFLPLIPLATVAVILYGMGLLPMAPLFSFFGNLKCRRILKKMTGVAPLNRAKWFWFGVGAGLLPLSLVELPGILTRTGLQMAAAEDPVTQGRGLGLLRALGDRELLLRFCYQRPSATTDLISLMLNLKNQVRPAQARTIFYRVTGLPFNSFPKPRLGRQTHWEVEQNAPFDEDQGSARVSARIPDLTLKTSRLDGSLDGRAALGYWEWTLVFHNDSVLNREARFQVGLPPDGVVSRLTLWINGEEREAAFGERARVAGAYQAVVARRRDPVLVTTKGKDRVMVQCFPIPPQGGEMKLRFGITVPLDPEPAGDMAAVRFPHLIERNFGIPEGFHHELWLESKSELLGGDTTLEAEAAPSFFTLRGGMGDRELAAPGQAILLRRDESWLRAWCPDPLDPEGASIRQILTSEYAEFPKNLALVVDGSMSLAPQTSEIAMALESLTPETRICLLIAGDTLEVFPLQPAEPHYLQKLQKAILDHAYRGGHDNQRALAQAWDVVAPFDGSVLWVHGPQPVALEGEGMLEQRFDRRPRGPDLFSLQIEPGPNHIFEALDLYPKLHPLPRRGSPGQDLRQWLQTRQGQIPHWRAQWFREESETPETAWGAETSDHLARLWAHREVTRVAYQADQRERAAVLATSYHLVTPVSGAVVLETAEQFEQAGLKPADPSTVPTIPEPETWLLLVVLLLLSPIFIVYLRRVEPWRSGKNIW